MSPRAWITCLLHHMWWPDEPGVIPRQTGSRVFARSYYILPILENVANLILHWVHMQVWQLSARFEASSHLLRFVENTLYQEAWEPQGPLMDTVYSVTEGRVAWHFCRTSSQFWVLIIAAGETFLLVAGAYPALNRPVLKADFDALLHFFWFVTSENIE